MAPYNLHRTLDLISEKFSGPRVVSYLFPLLWQLLVIITNNHTSSKSLSRISSEDHKKTQQGVPAVFLSYLYYYIMVYATNNYICPYVHALSLCLPHILLKAIIVIIWKVGTDI